MRKALTMFGAIAALAIGFLSTPPAAHAAFPAYGNPIDHPGPNGNVRCQAYENAAQTYPGDRIPNTTNKTHYFYCGSVKGWNMAHNEVTQLSSYTRNLLKAKLVLMLRQASPITFSKTMTKQKHGF